MLTTFNWFGDWLNIETSHCTMFIIYREISIWVWVGESCS